MKKLLALTAAALVFFSCKVPLDKETTGSGSVSVNFLQTVPGSRTILPDLAAGVDTYEVTLRSHDGFADKTGTATRASPSCTIADVSLGTWDIEVVAKAGAVTIATGSLLNQTVATDPLNVTVPLAVSAPTGSGNIALVVRVPDIATPDSVDFALVENDTGTPGAAVNVSLVSADGFKTAAFSQLALSAGTYGLVISFRQGAALVGTFRESVNIWSGLTSDKWIDQSGALAAYRDFSAAELNALMNSSLSNLSISGSQAGSLVFASGTTSYDVGNIFSGPAVGFTAVESVTAQKLSYTWNGGASCTVTNGQAVTDLSLVGGSNALTVTVVSPNGKTTKTYTVAMNWNPVYKSLTGMELVRVPEGTFQRDTDALNTSYVSAFMIGRYEVTQTQWRAAASAAYPPGTSDCLLPIAGTVTWYDMVGFCNALSSKDGLDPVYTITGWDGTFPVPIALPVSADWTKNGYRLPTEMEWMWAAMGATADRFQGYTGTGTNTKGYSKAFAGDTGGNAVGDYAWYSPSGLQGVGQKLPNELGLFDMSGNVFEWCWDKGDFPPLAYPSGTLVNYHNEAETYRIDRGGSFTTGTAELAIAYRTAADQAGQGANLGFRVARFNSPQVSAPQFSIVGGTYSSVQTVTLTSTTPGSTIKYTTDGSDPSASVTALSGTTVEVAQPLTITAVAQKFGCPDSFMAASNVITISDNGRIYVSAAGNDANQGTIAAPKLTLNEAITVADALFTNGEVWVAEGSYGVNANVSLKSGISLFGSYLTDFSARNLAGTGSVIHDNRTTMPDPNTTIMAVSLFAPTRFDGFIVEAATTTDQSHSLRSEGGGTNLIVSNNTFRGGQSSLDFFPIVIVSASSPLFYNNVVIGGKTMTVNMRNFIFYIAISCNPVIVSNTFIAGSNTVNQNWIFAMDNTPVSHPYLKNNVIVDYNTASTHSILYGALGANKDQMPYCYTTNLFYTAPTAGLPYYVLEIPAGKQIIPSNFTTEAAPIYPVGSQVLNYNDPAWRNICAQDPLLVNPLQSGSGDYRLQAGSPARAAGTDLSLMHGFNTDRFGNPRTPPWSIGAFEQDAP